MIMHPAAHIKNKSQDPNLVLRFGGIPSDANGTDLNSIEVQCIIAPRRYAIKSLHICLSNNNNT